MRIDRSRLGICCRFGAFGWIDTLARLEGELREGLAKVVEF